MHGTSLPTSRKVHVWQFGLDRPAADLDHFTGLLCDEERARAARFRFDRDRTRFIVAHATLRTILAKYLGLPAANLVFGATPEGKPLLDPLPGSPKLDFNLSHSTDTGLLAVGLDRPVGIDIETIRPMSDYDTVARMVFTPAEYLALQTVPEAQRLIAFYAGWTRKEAYLKGIGANLSRLSEFSVDIAPDARRITIADTGQLSRPGRPWSILTLNLLPGYSGAVSAEGTGWDFELFSI